MSENNMNNPNQTENSARAEKIRAIREAMRKAREAEETAAQNDTIIKEEPAEAPKVQSVSDLLAEVERMTARAEKAAQPEDTAPAKVYDDPAAACEALISGEISSAEDVPAEDAEISAEEIPVDETPVIPERPAPMPKLIKPLREKSPAVPEEMPQAVQPEIPAEEPAKAVLPIMPPDGPKKKKKKKKKKTLLQRIRGLFPEKGDSVLEIIRKIFFLIAVIVVIVCGYRVGDYYLDLFRNYLRNREVARLSETYEPVRNYHYDDDKKDPEMKYYDLLERARKLLDINPEIVGYLEIPTIDGDPILSLPVVQASNNEDYLVKSFDLKESRAGALFLDWRCKFDRVYNHHLTDYNSENQIIYGHNMADGSMFGSFKYYHKVDEYYSQHPIVHFDSNYETYTYKIFSVMILDADDETDTNFDCWNRANFRDEEEFYWFVNECKRRTIRTNEVDVKYGDPLLTLCTCNTYLGERGRLVLVARRLRNGEDLYEGTQNSQRNPNIKWPTMYYNIVPNEKYDPDNFVPYGPDVKKDDKKDDKKDEQEDNKKDEKKDDGEDNPSETEE